MSPIHTPADYLALWQRIIQSEDDLDFEQVYFHHAQQWIDGRSEYCRHRIQQRFNQGAARGVAVDVVASLQTAASGELQVLFCCIKLADGSHLAALAEVCKGRIKREWVQIAGALADGPMGLQPALLEVGALCGFSGYPVPPPAQEALHALHQAVNPVAAPVETGAATGINSAASQLLVEHCVAEGQQVALLCYLFEYGSEYRKWQSLCLYQSVEGVMELITSSHQLPANAMPSEIRS
ncbi:MAG: hypothetical protein ACR2PW_01390 [Gammaproteobacteria bacterium]